MGLAINSCKEVKADRPGTMETNVEKAANSTIATYEDLEGNPLELSDFKGKRLLVNYWATWCRPCIEEMPDMETLQSMLSEENYVFLFASDQSMTKITDFKKARGFDLDFIRYNGAYSDERISALPTTFIYNTMGEQVLRMEGGMKWDSPEMIEKLRNVP